MKQVLLATLAAAAVTLGSAFHRGLSSTLAPCRRHGIALLKVTRTTLLHGSQAAHTRTHHRRLHEDCCATWRSSYPLTAFRRDIIDGGYGELQGEGGYEMEDGLNPSQQEAVVSPVGPVRVVAGPGSGKTRVLTRRVAHLVRNLSAPPWSILAVTFTNKAAAEMRGRVAKILGKDVTGQITLGTFHSVCARLMRRFGEHLPALIPGLDRQFTIFDTDDSRKLVAEIIKEMGLDSTKVKPQWFISQMSWLKSQGKGPNDVMELNKGRGGGTISAEKKKMLKTLAELFPIYQRRLAESNAVDFDDLLLVTLRLLKENKGES
ncbi:unnamed protein product [Choristocarpus tenellus]